MTGIFVRPLAHSLGRQTRARVAQWPPLRKCLSLTQARSRPTYGVRISLSRIDDHLARAIVIFSLSRGTFLLRLLLLLLLFLPARPAVSSRKHKLKVSALPDLLDTYSASSQVSQHDTRGRRYRADEEKVTQGVSEASPSALPQSSPGRPVGSSLGLLLWL